MNQNDISNVTSLITEYFLSKNKNVEKETIKVFVKYLMPYDYEKVKNAIIKEIEFGSEFPSLASIISQMNGNVDIKKQCIMSWNRIIQATFDRTTKNLSVPEKKALKACTAGYGITRINGCNDYDRSDMMRSYKTELELILTGKKEQYIESLQNSDVKQIINQNINKLEA